MAVLICGDLGYGQRQFGGEPMCGKSIESVKKVTGRAIQMAFTERRAGEEIDLVGFNEKAKKILDREPKYAQIETVVHHALGWHMRMRGIC